MLMGLEDGPADVWSGHRVRAPRRSPEPDRSDHGSVEELGDERAEAIVVPCRDATLKVSRTFIVLMRDTRVDVTHQLGVRVDPRDDAVVGTIERPQREPTRQQLHQLDRNPIGPAPDRAQQVSVRSGMGHRGFGGESQAERLGQFGPASGEPWRGPADQLAGSLQPRVSAPNVRRSET